MKTLFTDLPGAGIALSLLLGSFATHAQGIPPEDSAKWYVGAQASLSHKIYIIEQGMGFGAAAATVGGHGGYQFSPRLAVQAGLSYGRGSTPADIPSGQFNYYPQAEYITSLLMVPVLMRWAFAARPRRFRVEGLAGVHLSYFNLRQRGGGVETEPRYVLNTRSVNGYLDFGLGSRLRLGSRLELAADLLLNLNYQRANNFYIPLAPGGSVALGANYRLR
ncbi:outer membrane beta-barrel protein [Hymenobacter antarcticus]|uniref:Outer membrane protein beta-barrel domain-containing protein n=1 Tax=Hymenobacter antarcticus TaxID=486270 RepID=A0ABP7QWM1_9BACT